MALERCFDLRQDNEVAGFKNKEKRNQTSFNFKDDKQRTNIFIYLTTIKEELHLLFAKTRSKTRNLQIASHPFFKPCQ